MSKLAKTAAVLLIVVVFGLFVAAIWVAPNVELSEKLLLTGMVLGMGGLCIGIMSL